MTDTPQFLPLLSKGGHHSPEEGACFMEYASFLAGERFSDSPLTADPALSYVMININDNIGKKRRHLLAPLIPLVLNTSCIARGVTRDCSDDFFAKRNRWERNLKRYMLRNFKFRYDGPYWDWIAYRRNAEPRDLVYWMSDKDQMLELAEYAVHSFRKTFGMEEMTDVQEQLKKAITLTGKKVEVGV